MVTRRGGHSLPELIVAVTFLAATLVAVGGAAVLGARWTAGAVARQDAVRLAAAVLDSVARAPAPVAGSTSVRGLGVRWWPDATGGVVGVRVRVTRANGPVLAELLGAVIPTAPTLPDVGDVGAAPGGGP